MAEAHKDLHHVQKDRFCPFEGGAGGFKLRFEKLPELGSYFSKKSNPMPVYGGRMKHWISPLSCPHAVSFARACSLSGFSRALSLSRKTENKRERARIFGGERAHAFESDSERLGTCKRTAVGVKD